MKTLLTFVALLLTVAAQAQSANASSTPDHHAWIDAQQQEEMLTIRGKFDNRSAQEASFRYELVTTKQGTSGNSRSTQAGSFSAQAGKETTLSNVSINVSEEDTYVIELRIFHDDAIYLEDKIVR